MSILLRLHRVQQLAKPLILNDGRAAHPFGLLQKRRGRAADALYSAPQPVDPEVIELDILTAEDSRHLVALKVDLLAVVRQGQPRTDINAARDGADMAGSDPKLAIQVVRAGNAHREVFIEAFNEPREGGRCRLQSC